MFIGNFVAWKQDLKLETKTCILETQELDWKHNLRIVHNFQCIASNSEFQSAIHVSNLNSCFQPTMFPVYVSNTHGVKK